MSALKGEAARKREAKVKPEDGNMLSANSEKGGLTFSKSQCRLEWARLGVVEVIYFGEDVAEWLDEEVSWRGTT